MDIVPSDRIKLLTASIAESTGLGFVLSLQFDDYETITADLTTVKNGAGVTNAIRREIKNLEGNSILRQNVDTAIADSFFALNQVQIQNLNKNNGKLTFFFPDGSDEEVVQNGYKKLFGTSATNNDFYTLYPPEMFDSDNIFYDDEDNYWYCPTVDKPLKFTYRKLITTYDEDTETYTSESRPAKSAPLRRLPRRKPLPW